MVSKLQRAIEYVEVALAPDPGDLDIVLAAAKKWLIVEQEVIKALNVKFISQEVEAAPEV